MTEQRTIDGVAVERTAAGGWRYSDAVYNEKWLARVLAKTSEQATGCWIWLGQKAVNGYGQVQYRGRCTLVHRKVYEVVNKTKVDRWCTSATNAMYGFVSTPTICGSAPRKRTSTTQLTRAGMQSCERAFAIGATLYLVTI